MFSCCISDEARKNASITKGMQKEQEQVNQKVSILILGTGDSGKTTLRKQLVSVHGTKFEKEAFRESFSKIILGNLIDGALEVLVHLNRPEEISILKDRAREVGSNLSPELAALLIQTIWTDPAFMQALNDKHQNKIQIQDCFMGFALQLKTYPAWGGPTWIPSTEDCVRSRVRTSGVVKDEVTINGVEFTLFDAGGQRAERRKWMHCFEACTAAIYVAAISDYDMVLFEDRNKNRLQEAVELFYESANSPWLEKTTMIVFLNKKDLFLEKFVDRKIPINSSGLFPTAPANEEGEEAAIKWFKQLFSSQKVSTVPGQKSQVYIHVTTATDPNNVRTVFQICASIVLKQNMKDAGFST